MNKFLKRVILISFLAPSVSPGLDLGEALKDGIGYRIERVEVEGDFEKISLSLIRKSGGEPLILNGLISDGGIKIEISVSFDNGQPIAYHFQKWEAITHPALSKEGEISDRLTAAQSGKFPIIKDSIRDDRLKAVFDKSVARAIEVDKP